MVESNKVEIKSFWKSKTFWASIAYIVAGIAFYVNGQLSAGLALTSAGIISTALRYYTKTEIEWKL